MSKFGYLLLLKNEPIGIFDDTNMLNNFVDGCVKNNLFWENDIKIKKYNMNSINCLDSEKRKISAKELRLREDKQILEKDIAKIFENSLTDFINLF